MRVPDRARKKLRPAGRDDDPAADLLDDLRGLAFRIRRNDHRPGDGEDPVQPAGDDVARESRREADDMHVRS